MSKLLFEFSKIPVYLENRRPVSTPYRGPSKRITYKKKHQRFSAMYVAVVFHRDGSAFFSDEEYGDVCSQSYEPFSDEVEFAVNLALSPNVHQYAEKQHGLGEQLLAVKVA